MDDETQPLDVPAEAGDEMVAGQLHQGGAPVWDVALAASVARRRRRLAAIVLGAVALAVIIVVVRVALAGAEAR